MTYLLALIVGLTLIFVFLQKAKIIKACPICAGVVVTWFIGTVGIYTNQSWADPLLIAILLGASLGAAAHQYGSRFGLVWKTLVVLLGLPAIFYTVSREIWPALGLMAALLAVTILFGKKRPASQGESKDIFKECC